MKTIVVLSDTHGNRKAIDGIDGVLAECDTIIHLGDTSSDGSYICGKYPDKTVIVNGNCDIPKLGGEEAVIEIENLRIFACHGHTYSVKTTLARLAEKAKNSDCALALYGHTHEAREDVIDGVTLINPGCMTNYGNKSYLYLVVNGDKFTAKNVPVI